MRTLAIALVLAGTAIPAGAQEVNHDIVATAIEAGSFKTLVKALQQAGLDEALRGPGPFTVFAPTDQAFSRVNLTALKPTLLFHVVRGRVTSADLARTSSLETLNGQPLPVSAIEGRARVAGASLTSTDIACSNGVIHVVDRVLLPPTPVLRIASSAIERGVPRFNAGEVADCVAIYEVAARALLELPSLTVLDRTQIGVALAHDGDATARAWELRRALDAAVGNESFRPLVEAPLPEGFPMPGPLGRVVVKSYPRYRAARAEGRGTFWTLFNHIKRNNVQMTAPVEMTMDDSMRAKDMAFLYEGPKQGAAGRQGRVAVLDLEAVTVLSFGMRGMRSRESVKLAREALLEQVRRDGWEVAGEWRLMGYNSPMVPAARRFWELQVPVKPLASATSH
jgi:uncharacterized surface protein with fasciclin (FAS1) repeats